MAEPRTFLHDLDPRVKQAWLVALVVLPAWSGASVRGAVAAVLVLLTIVSLPRRVWQDQLKRMLLLSGFLFVSLALGTDGVAPVVQPRRPPPLLEGLSPLPRPAGGYSYVLFKWGWLQLTRRGVALAAASSLLSFIVLQSASLCMTTTQPEQQAAALRWALRPLRLVGAPVDEAVLTLLLSLRFVGLVFDEVRNLALGVVSRGVQWQSLKFFGTLDLFAVLVGRLFSNLSYSSEQISQAMVARGYRGKPECHEIHMLTKLSMTAADWLGAAALVALAALVAYLEAVAVVP